MKAWLLTDGGVQLGMFLQHIQGLVLVALYVRYQALGGQYKTYWVLTKVMYIYYNILFLSQLVKGTQDG